MTPSSPSREQTAEFQAWRAVALETMPYMASTLFALRVLDAPGLGTFAVDRHLRVYVDFETVTERGVTWCAESLLHECSHVLQDHATTADDLGIGPSQRKTYNVATDCSINDDLVAAGCRSFLDGDPLPAQIGEPDGQTPHHYYATLRQMQQDQQNGHDDGQSGDGPGDGHSTGSGTGSDSDAGGGSGGQPFRGCGSGSGGEAAPCELDPSDDLDGQAPAATSQEKERVRVATATAITEHASKGRGTVPGGMVETADTILAPSTTPWQQVLASHVRRTVAATTGQFDTDRNRRSRRRHRATVLGEPDETGTRPVTGRLVVPGTYQPVPTIEVVRDTSGSMSDEDLAVVLREIEAISTKIGVRGDQLRVTDVDHEVHPSVPFRDRRSVEQVHGRGGTDMRLGIAAATQRRQHRPTIILVVTDGVTPWPAERPRVPVVAAIVGDHEHTASVLDNDPPPHFITTVALDPAG